MLMPLSSCRSTWINTGGLTDTNSCIWNVLIWFGSDPKTVQTRYNSVLKDPLSSRQWYLHRGGRRLPNWANRDLQINAWLECVTKRCKLFASGCWWFSMVLWLRCRIVDRASYLMLQRSEADEAQEELSSWWHGHGGVHSCQAVCGRRQVLPQAQDSFSWRGLGHAQLVKVSRWLLWMLWLKVWTDSSLHQPLSLLRNSSRVRMAATAEAMSGSSLICALKYSTSSERANTAYSNNTATARGHNWGKYEQTYLRHSSWKQQWSRRAKFFMEFLKLDVTAT